MLKSLRDFLLGQRSGNIAFFFSLVAFVFSLLFLLYLGPVKAGDTPSYMSITNHILAGQFYTDLNDIFRPPGYPLFLALLLRVSGGQLAVVAIGQVFFFAATAGLTYLAARQVFGEKVARLSGWLVALNPALAYFAVVIEAEALLVFLTTCTLYLVISGVVRQQQRYFLFAGLASAIGLSIKPVGLPLGLLIVGAILFVPKLEKRLQKSIILLLPITGVYFGWSAHNYIKFGALEYNPIYGLNLLERTAYLDDSQVSSKILKDARAIYQDRKERQVLGPQTDDMYYWWAVIETSRQYSATLNLTQKNSEFFNLAVELIKNNPTAYLRNTIGELVYIWAGYSLHPAKSRPIIQPESKAIDKEWSFLVIGLMLGSIMFILVSFASIQIVRTKKWFALVYIFPSLFIPLLMALVSVTGYRYRLMVEPLIITLVSYALLEIQPALNKWGLTLNGGEIRRST